MDDLMGIFSNGSSGGDASAPAPAMSGFGGMSDADIMNGFAGMDLSGNSKTQQPPPPGQQMVEDLI